MVRFSSIFEIKSGIVPLVNNALAEHSLPLYTMCWVTTKPTVFQTVKGET